jgi:acetoin utilization protein AcuB
MPVVENGKLVGVVSEKDLLKLIKAQPIAGMAAMLIKDMPTDSRRVVAEIMTSHPITISSSASIADALKVMAANNLKRLIVVDSGKLVGIVRAADLFRKIFGK